MENVIYYDFEKFRLDVINEQLLKDNEPIPLTHKAFKTLLILVQNYGQLVKKEDIINQIWHDSFVEDANLTQQIYVLRKTLGNNKHGKPFIETIPKRGYCFIGEVDSREGVLVKSAAISRIGSDDAVLDEQFIYVKGEDGRIHISGDYHQSENSQKQPIIPILSSEKTKIRFVSQPIVFAIVVIGLIGLSLISYLMFQPAKPTGINSIAVLPFKPIGEESNNEKMGFGMADAVITSLSKQQKIPIRPTSAVFQFAEKNFDPIAAGKQLGVDSVLEGTVQRDGEWVRVSVRLIKIADGSTIWAENFDEKFTYIFAVQDAISTKVAKSLTLNLSNAQEQELTARNTSNTEAYQAYQNGRFFWNKRSKEDLEKAVMYFQKAIEIDGNYAIAYAMLADSYNMLYYYGFSDNSKETIDKADIAAQKALALNKSIPESYIAVSYVKLAKYKDFESSIQSLENALQLSPYNPTARIRYGWQLLRKGNLEGALEQMRIAQENDPLSPVSNSALCSILILKRNFPEALKYSEKAVEMQPNAPLVKVQLASVYFLNGKTEGALPILQEEIKVPHSKHDALVELAYIYGKTGKTKESEEIFSQLKSESNTSIKYNELALIAFTLGHKEESLKYFNLMIERNQMVPPAIRFDPYWDDIFKDEDFKKLINKDNQN